ncbi:DUF6240 domain-containing protein [Natronincola ferrireducens]|uniref:Hook-length control protein FliK n=1 Tax=Natronincola ferrireducens TaxID=393762 RepID=A0A1G8XRA9_9FIRM|nr:DUF6240 domain-containing protein [Natronincola ferrireducens]SDJ93202.1 hypothetical protein SAMN05660472_00307 [Natronincola ferrireducens]
MNNNLFQKINLGASQQYYTGSSFFKIRGTLMEKKEDMVKVNIGGDKIIEAQLKTPLEGKVGETVVIDKKEIIKSRLSHKEAPVETPNDDKEEIQLLEKLQLPINEETQGAVKALEKHGITPSKENILAFIASKGQLERVIEGLDYETAVKLMEKNIDIEEAGLEKVMDMVEETKGRKEGFSLLKFFVGGKKLPIEEAERIAYNLYGNKMGKDITDIIQALHKAGVEISIKNIDRIHRIFSKLDNLQTIKDDTIVDAIKNKIDTTIDNLYKLKNTIAKNVIGIGEKNPPLATKAYETNLYQPTGISDREIKGMEGDIKRILTSLQIKTTEEVLKLAKDLIKQGLELSQENIQRVINTKAALKDLPQFFNYEKAATLMASGLQPEKEEVTALLKKVKEENANNSVKTIENPQQTHRDEALQQLEKLQPQNLKAIMAMMKNMKEIPEQRETVLSLLIKNSIPMTFKSLTRTDLLINNHQQITSQIHEALRILEKSNNKELKDLGTKLRVVVEEGSTSLKLGKFNIGRFHQELGRLIEGVEDKLHLMDENTRRDFQQNKDSLRESLQLQSQLNKDDILLQVPVMMENQMKNLQIYILNKKKGSRKIDPNNMSVLLNFETNNMGNVNIYAAVNRKQVTMKIGVKSQRDGHLFEVHKKQIEGLLEGLGYELKEVSFKIEEKQNLFDLMEGITTGYPSTRRSLDMTV